MRSDCGPRLPLAGLLVTAVLALVWAAPVAAVPHPQADPPSDPAAKTEPAPESAPPEDPDSVADEALDETSDAESLLRIQQVVTADQAKLERLRLDLESRKAFLDELTGHMALFQTTRDEMQARLEGLESGSEEAASLRDEIRRLEEQYERFNRHASLTLEAEGALRKQILSLEGKIRIEHQALALFRLQGARSEESRDETQAPAAGAPTSPPVGSPGLPSIPGVPVVTSSPAASRAPQPLLPETAQQIEARQKLQETQRATQAADEAVVTFVQRKEALQVQIGLEETLLRVDAEALENLTGYALEREARLEALEAAGAPERELSERRAQLRRLNEEVTRVNGEVARRRLDLESLKGRLVFATSELERVTRYAEEKRQEADSARKWLVWLESPLHPGNLARWVVERGPRVLAVLLFAGFLLFLIRFSLPRIARTVVRQSRKARSSAINRADTLSLSFQSLATTLILAAGVLLVLQEAGLDVKTVLGGAAILGVAIAFGAQNLMRDYFTGFMILLEDQYELGDLVTIGDITGTVERVNMRITMLRDLEGRVHFIPNGQIGSLTNRTYDWARALVEIPVGPGEDVDRVMALLLDVAQSVKDDPEWADEIVDEPQMLGVDKFTESGVIVKLMLKTHPERMFPVRRELLRRVKKAFDAEGIEPGFPVRVLRESPRSES